MVEWCIFFVVYGYQGSDKDSVRLLLTDKLRNTVLAEAQVVCVGQLMLIVGGFTADHGIIFRLAKGISDGRFVDFVLAYSVGARKELDATCKFK